MLWILPINALVLLVWAHNLVVHWLMPFSSHHNILSIMPFILLVETMTGGAMIPRVTTRYALASNPETSYSSYADKCRFKHITSLILFSIAVYSAVYGVSYAYLLHHLANIFSTWLICIYLSSSGFSVRRLWRLLEGEEFSSSLSELGGSHVKKKP